MKITKTATITLDQDEIQQLHTLLSIGADRLNDAIRRQEMFQGMEFHEIQETLSLAARLEDV